MSVEEFTEFVESVHALNGYGKHVGDCDPISMWFVEYEQSLTKHFYINNNHKTTAPEILPLC